MGQPVTVIEKQTSRADVVRFETNRTLSGMGHEIFRSREVATKPKPVDEMARRLFDHGGVELVHINGNIITVQLQPTGSREGLKEVVEQLYIYYSEGVEVAWPEGASRE